MLFDTQFQKNTEQFEHIDKKVFEVAVNLHSLKPEDVKKLSSDERKTLKVALERLRDPKRANELDVGAVKNVMDSLRYRRPALSFFEKVANAWNSRFSGSISDAKLLQEIKTAEQKIWFNEANKYFNINEKVDGVFLLLQACNLGSLDAIEDLLTRCKDAGTDKMVKLIPEKVVSELYLNEGKIKEDLSPESRELYENIQSRDPEKIVAYLDGKAAEIRKAEQIRQAEEAKTGFVTQIVKWITSLRKGTDKQGN